MQALSVNKSHPRLQHSQVLDLHFDRRLDLRVNRLCYLSMIISPLVLVRNAPLIGPPRGGQIEADSDEQEGVGTRGSAGAGGRQRATGRGCRSTAARELPAGAAAAEAVPGART